MTGPQTQPPQILILIPAAGAGRRMRGGDKHLEPVAGVPVLRRLALAAATVGPVIVTYPPDHPGRAVVVAGTGADAVLVRDAAEGMAASLRAGAEAARDRGAAGLMILPGDMPEIGAAEIAALAAAFDAAPVRVVRGAAGPRAGHPVILPARLFAALAQLSGDTGARDLIAAEPAVLVPLPGLAALTDLDTPEAWADWRAGRAAPAQDS